MNYLKTVGLLGVLVLCGCSSETQHSQQFQESGSISFASFDSSEKTIVDTREFLKHEEVEYSIDSETPVAVGFKVDLTSADRQELQAKSAASGVFQDRFSGEVQQLPGGSGIGAVDGGVIEMSPVDGKIKFKFKNKLTEPHRFEVYTTSVNH